MNALRQLFVCSVAMHSLQVYSIVMLFFIIITCGFLLESFSIFGARCFNNNALPTVATPPLKTSSDSNILTNPPWGGGVGTGEQTCDYLTLSMIISQNLLQLYRVTLWHLEKLAG